MPDSKEIVKELNRKNMYYKIENNKRYRAMTKEQAIQGMRTLNELREKMHGKKY